MEETTAYFSKHTKHYTDSPISTATESESDEYESEDWDLAEALDQETGSSAYTSEDEESLEELKPIINGSAVEALKKVTVKVNGKEYKGLLDTGSTSTFITRTVAEKSALTKKLMEVTTSFTGLNNTPVGSPKSDTTIYLECPTITGQMIGVRTHAYVIDKLSTPDNLDVLVGINALKLSQHYIDPNTGRLVQQQAKNNKIGNYLMEADSEQTTILIREKAYEEVNIGATQPVRLGKDLTPEEKQVISDLILHKIEAFSLKPEDLGKTNICTHKITLTDTKPIKQQPYRIPESMRAEIEKQVSTMLELGVIRPSQSPWASPIVLVPKKNGETRICIDYRKLNTVTKGDAYPLPNIEDMLASICKGRIFTSLDIRAGYHQIELHENDKEKTAFVVPGGLYEFNRLPFGLTNAPATFQRLMNTILGPLIGNGVQVYLDDVLVYTKDISEHRELLRTVISTLQNAGLKLNISKCSFGLKELTFLGYYISKGELRPDRENVRAIIQMASPKTLREAQSIHGMLNYYRKFIPHFSQKATPITNLFKIAKDENTKKAPKFEWTSEAEQAFKLLKEQLVQPPILALYNPANKTNLVTDASIEGYGACVEQEVDGHWRPIAYASKKLNKAEKNYGITEMEAGAVMFGVNKFTSYLLGIPFTIITDHQALQFINNKNNLSAKMTRWAMRLQEFNFTVIYKTPTYTRTPDALSRLPVTGNDSENEYKLEDREFCYEIYPTKVKTPYYIKYYSESSDIEKECYYTNLAYDPRKTEKLRQAQRQDKNCNDIIKLIRENKGAPVKNYSICQRTRLLMIHITGQNTTKIFLPRRKIMPVIEQYYEEKEDWQESVQKDYHNERLPKYINYFQQSLQNSEQTSVKQQLTDAPSTSNAKPSPFHKSSVTQNELLKITQECCLYTEGEYPKLRATALRKSQEEDPICGKILTALRTSATLTLSQRKRYERYHIDPFTEVLMADVDRIMVPKTEIRKLVEQYHSFGHSGEWATYKRITEKYHYRGIMQVVKAIVSSCHTCQKNKDY